MKKWIFSFVLLGYLFKYIQSVAIVFPSWVQFVLFSFVMIYVVREGLLNNKDFKLTIMSVTWNLLKIIFMQAMISQGMNLVVNWVYNPKNEQISAGIKIFSICLAIWYNNNFWEKIKKTFFVFKWSLVIFKNLFIELLIMILPIGSMEKFRKFKRTFIFKLFQVTPGFLKKYVLEKNPFLFRKYTMDDIDKLGNNGKEFESYIAHFFEVNGYEAYTTTELRADKNLPKEVLAQAGSGEQGVDVIVFFRGMVDYDGNGSGYNGIIIQCKQYSTTVGNKAIQEIYSAVPMYEAHFKRKFKTMVITNNYYTFPATNIAKTNNVELIDRDQLAIMIDDQQKEVFIDENKKVA